MKDHDVMDQDLISTEEAEKASITELLQKLSSSEKGLSASEAKQRLQQYGYNEIAEKRVSSILKLLSYFCCPIPWMIEVAAMLSCMVRHWHEWAPGSERPEGLSGAQVRALRSGVQTDRGHGQKRPRAGLQNHQGCSSGYPFDLGLFH